MDNSPVSAINKTAEKQSIYLMFKRLFDILFSLTFLVLLSPLYLLISILIKLSSKGPIFFVTKRLGKNKKEIILYKFRTMYVDAEERLQELIQKDPELKHEWDFYRKLKNDPRCTPIGKFLRRTSLDEFPQFLNVLKGDLSIVGPRPHLTVELQKEGHHAFKKNVDKILSIKPGITGIWQTSGRNHLSFEDRIDLECLYIEKQSFLFDLYLVLKTIPSVLFSHGAY